MIHCVGATAEAVMAGQPGFFDLSDRYEALSAAGDPLERLAAVVDFEVFRGPLVAALRRSPRGRGGRPPFDPVLMFQEQDGSENRSPIDWKLITDLPVASLEEAVEKLEWYALRWKIEVFHKILKSGCHAEDAKLRTAERLVNLLAIYCVLSWRMFWMTMINRTAPMASPDIVLTKDEINLIESIVISRTGQPPPRQLSSYLTQIARLGGYLARQRDPPPGNTVIWRGWSRLMNMKLGIDLAGRTCG